MTASDRGPAAKTTTYAATILKLEGSAVMLGAGYAYQLLSGSWLWFFVLFLVPDLSMVGYVRGPRFGAVVYNVAHTYLLPAAMVITWMLLRDISVLRIAAFWTAHIGVDRMIGFGLKDVTGFKDTHLQRV